MVYRFEKYLDTATYDHAPYDEVLTLPYPLSKYYNWVELDADSPLAFVSFCKTGREAWINLADDRDLEDLHAFYF